MILVETSAWVQILRQPAEGWVQALRRVAGREEVALSRFTELELLMGARHEKEWELLAAYLDTQDYVPLSAAGYREAGRLFYDLRRRGRAVRSPLDCLIAQTALEHDLLLIHLDRDFETVAEIRPLRQVRLEP